MDHSGTHTMQDKTRAKTRKRKGYSRNGCTRCKGQRVRCDEQQPECGRCVRAGVRCTGCGPQLRWSTKHEIFQPTKIPERPHSKISELADTLSSGSSSQAQPSNHGVSPPPLGGNPSTRSAVPSQQPSDLPESMLDFIMAGMPDLDNSGLFEGSSQFNGSGDLTMLSGLGQAQSDFDAEVIPRAESHDISRTQSQQFWEEDESSPHSSSSGASSSLVKTPSRNTELIATYPAPVARSGMASPARALLDPASVLVEFYFKETAQLFSCFDSRMNPFRTIVSRLWDSSPLLYRTLQSMAAASLVEDFPELGAIGKQLRGEAVRILDENCSSDVDALLAMLMLGGSASWHDRKDLGLPFFNGVRRKLASMPTCAFDQHNVDYHFFHQSMTYWEMLLAYVAEDDTLDTSETTDTLELCGPLNFIPHPWTGFARDTQDIVQKIGRLVRRQRKLAFSHRFTSMAHIKQLEKDMALARELEKCLVNMYHPLENTVLDPEDGNTPVWHLLTLAEVYRLTGLIQLYHAFPDLLERRLVRDGVLKAVPDSATSYKHGDYSTQLRNNWLTSCALEALSMMKSIPVESGTRDFQPFILVSLSSELRVSVFPKDVTEAEGEGMRIVDHMAGLDYHTIEVSRMRRFIQSRLTSFLHILPPKPIHTCLDIVNEAWKRMDQNALQERNNPDDRRGSCEPLKDVYWMDVMIENGWETTMA